MKNTKKENETHRDRFKRLASYRTNLVLEKLRILGNCANRQAYEYDDDDIEKIFSAIDRELKHIRAKFRGPGKKFNL